VTSVPYCIYPWYHQKIGTDGNALPCCAWSKSEIQTRDGFIHSDFMQDLRQKMLDHQPPSNCWKCSHSESHGKKSVRQVGFEDAEFTGIDWQDTISVRSQEVDLSNVCNLRCRMCSSTRSSKWAADEIAMGQPAAGLMQNDWHLSIEEAKVTRTLTFLGGEPLLHQDRIYTALRLIDQHGEIDKLYVMMSTNAMQFITDELLDLLLKCRLVRFCLSIDGFGAISEYIRSDSDWETINHVTMKIDDLRRNNENIVYHIQPTISIYNYDMMDELVDWANNLSTKPGISPVFLHWPNSMSALNIPMHLRLPVSARYEQRSDWPIYGQMYSIVSSFLGADEHRDIKLLDDFHKLNSKLDELRNTSLAASNPELDAFISTITEYSNHE